MELFSHLQPINPARSSIVPGSGLLADAFAEFISASARLEASYETLQMQVTYLSQELADRNSALKASLIENERVHRALLQIVDSMPCGVLVVEEDGSVSVINSEGWSLLGIESPTAQHLDAISLAAGVDLVSFLGRDDGAEDEKEFCKATAGGRRWLLVHERALSPVHDSGSHVRKQTILILRDITAHKQAEQARERARRATALAEVATTLAHEIRNPLASLELFAGLIAKGGEDTQEWISHLRAGIRSLAGTVNNVLSVHGSGFPSLTPLDLASSISSSVEFARPIADQAGISLIFESDHSGVRVQGNSSGLQQVVLNMVCNAIRHTRSGGTVRVLVRESKDGRGLEPGRAIVLFEDTGGGIAAQDLERIFHFGFSGNGNTSGLGLSVCSQIVQQHGGLIRVDSKLGVGTRFHVELPSL
jgi:two-component system sensor histidine kinase FlrB